MWLADTASQLSTGFWSFVGLIGTGFTGVLAFAGKLISDLRADNKALQNKVIDQAIPALQQSSEAAKELTAATQRILDAVLVAETERRAKRR